ncbi:hypothetical protein [Dyadobacter sp. Leaf189]|nr:hypothetical protein [Dyadobacter sp. Leaf189]
MNTIDKSKRRIPREVITYPTLEAFVEAKLKIVREQLKNVDFSLLEKDKK